MTEEERPLLAAMRRGRTHARELGEERSPMLQSDRLTGDTFAAELEEAESLMRGALLRRERARVQLRAVAALAPPELAARARTALDVLRSIEEERFAPVRARLLASPSPRTALFEALAERSEAEHDLFVDRLLGIHDPPPSLKGSDLENAPYLASSLHELRPILDLIGPDDVVYDLGSGLGKVPFLVRWLTGARAIGVEHDPHLGAAAEHARRALDLDVELVIADAREVDYRGGTFFYFFEPFRGAILDEVFARIREATRGHAIRLAIRWVTDLAFAPPGWMNEVATYGRVRVFEA